MRHDVAPTHVREARLPIPRKGDVGGPTDTYMRARSSAYGDDTLRPATCDPSRFTAH